MFYLIRLRITFITTCHFRKLRTFLMLPLKLLVNRYKHYYRMCYFGKKKGQ